MAGRPHTAIGTYGQIGVRRQAGRFLVSTRYRDADGRLRVVTARGESQSAARANLKLRLLNRPGFGTSGMLSLSSSFSDLVALWLADLELQDLVEQTKENYRDDIRLHVLPAFQYFTLGEITTGRVERFLKSELTVSYSRANHSRPMLNLLFGFALRYDAIPRTPVEGTSQLKKPTGTPEALTLEQIAAIRDAPATWRAGPDV
ncbi:MAG TPA: site-specific integrase, partial [Marisediminicola sp.]|nr:site-specific integrase [Marisediminicola sp.]